MTFYLINQSKIINKSNYELSSILLDFLSAIDDSPIKFGEDSGVIEFKEVANEGFHRFFNIEFWLEVAGNGWN